ncbi:MAG: T9SS type A sorting domain-containing protein [bacterium]
MKRIITSIAILVILLGSGNNLQSYNINKVIWIPASGKGTVVAVHDSSYKVLGEYLTAPPSLRDSASPSRYAINYNGDVIFGHRKLGAVTILHYKKGDDILTSTGLGNIIPWTSTGPMDEAVVKFIHLPKFGDTRHISVTTDKKIIVGSTWVPDFFYVIDGTTYEIIDSITGACGGGYGGITINEHLWSVSKNENKTLKYNLSTGEQKCYDIKMSYGITSLPSGSVYNTLYNDKQIYKLSPSTDLVMDTISVGKTARGLTYNPYNERLYIANSLEDYITEMDTLGNITDNINLSKYLAMQTPPFRDPTGVLINGFDILVTCFYQDTILVYNTLTDTAKQKIYIGPAARPYFYNSTTNLSHFYAEIQTIDVLNFNRELCKNERSDFITVTNDGFADLHVTRHEITGADADKFYMNPTQLPFTLKPNESKNLAVWSYRPVQTGALSAQLKLYSDAINADVDSSITIELRSEYQEIKHVVEGLTSDTVYFEDIPQDATVDTIIYVRNYSSIPSYIEATLNGEARFDMLNESLFNLDVLEYAPIEVSFNSNGLRDGNFYTDLIIKDECGEKIITIAAILNCKPQIFGSDTIYACRAGDEILFQPFFEIMALTPPIDSVYLVSEDGVRFEIDEAVVVERSMVFTIFAWSKGCWAEKDIWVVAPDVDFISVESRRVISGNPIVIGPGYDFEETFKGMEIEYIWSPKDGIVYEFDHGLIAVDPDTSTTYHLLIIVDDRCQFTYRCDVEVTDCNLIEDILSSGLIKIYPNPANDYISIDFSENLFYTTAKLSFINPLGIRIKELELMQYEKNHKLYTGDINSGTYLMQLKTGNDLYNLGTILIYR